MAGPLNGLGAQQIPLANSFQPGKDAEQNRKVSEEKSAQTQSANGNYPSVEARKEEFRARQVSESSNEQDSSSNRRGSLVDISV